MPTPVPADVRDGAVLDVEHVRVVRDAREAVVKSTELIQCAVARRPSSGPTVAGTYAPLHSETAPGAGPARVAVPAHARQGASRRSTSERTARPAAARDRK